MRPIVVLTGENMGARKKLALEQFNRDNILTAAKELFETKGVQETTMDDIALQADYSKSTIYVYFRSKEEIYNSIVVDYLDVLIGELSVDLMQDKTFEDSYYKLCEGLVRFCERYPKYYTSLMIEEKATNSRKQSANLLPGILPELYDLLERLIEKGKESKVLNEKLDTKPTALYLWSALSGIIQISEQKKKEIEKNTGMSPDAYRKFAFRTLYESLAGQEVSGTSKGRK